ncbi:10697_t:CDS:2 [Funneliformis caledonium]|uniref:10697_t:CDS:1 n=1 Tax=Funneliformis caledonium TaxID=1117310 RepID=A0A9N9IDD3_9GLOM|nr:10697_t:CDS:2 [Funneliformis caledonium]
MDIEQAFKQQVQNNYSQKMQELANLNGWDNFWNAGYSIIFNLLVPKKLDSRKNLKETNKQEIISEIKLITMIQILLIIIEAILQKTFTKEELQYKDNIIFSVTVILMFLNPSYNQAEISASKVQKHMKQWNSDPFIRSLVDLSNQESNNSNEYYEDMDSNNNNNKSDNSSDNNEDN